MADLYAVPRPSYRWVWVVGILLFDSVATGVEYVAHVRAMVPPPVVVAPTVVQAPSAGDLGKVEAFPRLALRALRREGVPLPAAPGGPIVGTLQAILSQAIPRPP